ncbi:uncharacterized protein [Diadema antillarum]|uniref:uncharacterized protein n=1 Tax=Diadema antillarum TaxID=105358 RepID=UPI003A8495A3
MALSFLLPIFYILFAIPFVHIPPTECSRLPENYLQNAGTEEELETSEKEILVAFKGHLNQTLRNYQAELHHSLLEELHVYNRRKRRELVVNENLYWDVQTETDIPTDFSIAKHFYSDGDDYLILGYNQVSEGTYTTDAEIFKFSTTTGTFTTTGVTFTTYGLADIEPFLISDEIYIAVANGQFGATSYQGLSQIVTFDPAGPSINHVQYMYTYGASALEAFLYEGDTYLAVANQRRNSYFRYLVDSKIYRYAGAYFDEVVSLTTHGASDIAAATIGFNLYVAIAQYVDNDGSYTEGTMLYQMDTSTGELLVEMIKLQVIPSSAPKSLEMFIEGGHTYLAIANHLSVVNEVENPITDSVIYWWATDNQFIEYQTIQTDGAMQFEHLELSYSPSLLAVADLTGLKFYHFSDVAWWEEADTDLHLNNPSVRLTNIHVESFSMDNTEYLATASSTFWTTEHRNLTSSNFFSFDHVNETTTTFVNTTAVYLPSCIQNMTSAVDESTENVSKTIEKLGKGLSKTKEGQVVNSDIVITGTVKLPALKTKKITIKKGQDYELDPALPESINTNAGRIDTLEAETPSFVTKSTEQTIEGPVTATATQTIVTGNGAAGTFTSDDSLISNVNLPYIDSVALRSTGDQTMTGQVTFNADLTVGTAVTVSGLIGGISVPANVMDKSSTQTVDGSKTFDANVNFHANVDVDGTVNGLDLNTDVVLTSRTATVAGTKTFSQDITLSTPLAVASGKTVDTVDVSEFSSLVLSVSEGGSITGDVDFSSPLTINGNVVIDNDEINGVDFVAAYDDAVFVDTTQTITASKTFLNDVEASGNIDVTGTVNGVDISEQLFTLSTDQTVTTNITVIEGKVTANQDIIVEGEVNNIDLSEEVVLVNTSQTIQGLVIFEEDIVVNGYTYADDGVTVDGVDLSVYAASVARIDQDSQTIAGAKTFTKLLTISGDLSVGGTINDVDMDVLYTDVLLMSESQSFDVAVDIKSSIEVSGDATLQDTIDTLSIPESLVLLSTADSISGLKTFSALLDVTGNLNMASSKTVNGKDLSVFDTSILKKSGAQSVSTTGITFNNALTVSGDVSVTGTVNGYTIPDDFLLLAGEQTISGERINYSMNQTFNQPSLPVNTLMETVTLTVTGTLDDVNINNLYRQALLTSNGNKCTVAGQKSFPTLAVNGAISVTGTVDGVNLATLTSTAVYLHGTQSIAGDKTLTSNVHFNQDVSVTNQVNSLDFAEKAETVISKIAAGPIRGQKTFSGGMDVDGDVDVNGLVNGVNMTKFEEVYLSKEFEQVVSGHKTFTQSLYLADLKLAAGKTLDNVDPSDFLLLSSDEGINVAITFVDDFDVEGDATVTGDINTVDIVELSNTVVRLTGADQVVDGAKSFPSITVHNNIVIEPLGLVDGVDVSDLADRVLVSTQSNDISVRTVFSGGVTISGNLDTEANIGGVNIGNLLQDAVLLSENFDITGTVVFDSEAVIIMTDMTFEDDLTLTVTLDRTTLSNVLTTTVLASTEQEITGNVVFDDNVVLQKCLSIDGTTDNIDLSEYAVLKSGEQTVSGCTRFQAGFRVNGDMTVGGTVDDVNLATLISERVTYSTAQTITGTWTLADFTANGDVDIDGTLNDIDVGGDLVTISDNAVITGTKDFDANIIVTEDLDSAEINDVDIVALSQKVVLNEGSFSIDGQKTFESAITIETDTDVTGLVNCVDVGLLSSSYDTSTSNFDSSLASLNTSMRDQCISAASMQSSLGEQPLVLTHWEDVADIENPAAGHFHSVTLEGGDTILSLAESYHSAVDRCIGTQLYLCPADWISCVLILEDLLPAATLAYLYSYRGDTFIVLLPSQQTGQCDEHHDEKVNVLTVLKLEDEDFNVTLETPHALGAAMFEMDGNLFLAVGDFMDDENHDTDTSSIIFQFNDTTQDFDVFQKIITHGAYSVAHLSWRDKTWLCFANNALDHKSPIYVFDEETNQFVIDEEQGTNHASDVSMFLVDGVPFTVISSEKLIGDEREAEFHRDLTVLAYRDGGWVLLESIQAYGIIDTTVFAVGEFVYLVSVSLEGGILSVFEWHHAGMFEVYQELPFSNQYSAHAFIHNGEIMLALARPAFTSVDIYSWKSKLMRATVRGKTKDTFMKAW